MELPVPVCGCDLQTHKTHTMKTTKGKAFPVRQVSCIRSDGRLARMQTISCWQIYPSQYDAIVERMARAMRDANGTPEALAAWKRNPQLVPCDIYAKAALKAIGIAPPRKAKEKK